MRFYTDAPPPVYVGEIGQIDGVIRHCLSAKILGVDTETLGLLKNEETGLKHNSMNDQVIVMGLSPDDDTRYLVPRKHLHHFRPVLESEVVKALTYAKFDVHRLMNSCGARVAGPWADTVVLDFLVDEDTRENRHGLKECMADYFNMAMAEYKDIFGKEDPRAFEPGHPKWDQYLDYSSLDPWATRKLAILLMEKLSKMKVWQDDDTSSRTLLDMYWDTEEPQLQALWNMERRGIQVDQVRLQDIAKSLTQEMDTLAADICRRIGKPINPNSGDQIGAWLFGEMGFQPLAFTPTGKPQTDEATLVHFGLGKAQVEECKLILAYKKASKLRGTYAEGLMKWVAKDGRIHTNYSPTKATGRLGSNDPNLQNIPRPDSDPHGIRAAFIPRAGCKFIVADYGQLEMRILAYASGDQTMIDAIKSGLDMHSFTASRMTGKTYDEFIAAKKAGEQWATDIRTAAKSVGFGIVYGITKFKLSEQLSETLNRYVSEDEAQGYIDMYLDTFPGVRQYMVSTKQFAKRHGYVQTLCGRYRRLSKIRSPRQGERGHAERQAINAPIQGSAADIVKRIMIMTENDDYLREDLGCVLLHQVHDELIYECPEGTVEEARRIIQEYGENPFMEPLPVPLEFGPKIVNNWKEAK